MPWYFVIRSRPVPYLSLKITPWDQLHTSSAIIVSGRGGMTVVRSGVPTRTFDERSLRISLANLTAALILISPAPCSNRLNPANGCAVYIRSIFAMFGVNDGFACNSSAAAPATMGVAIEDPLMYIIRRFSD